MVGVGDIRMLLRPHSVAGDDVAGCEDVESGADDAYIHGGADEGSGHGVFDGLSLDVPVAGDFRLLPAHVLPGLVGQAEQVAGFTVGEPVPPGPGLAAERGAVVDAFHPVVASNVELVDNSKVSFCELVDDRVRSDVRAGFV